MAFVQARINGLAGSGAPALTHLILIFRRVGGTLIKDPSTDRCPLPSECQRALFHILRNGLLGKTVVGV